MIAPDKSLLEDPSVLTIELGGERWPVPKLAPRQNEVVVPILLRLIPKLTEVVRGQAPGQHVSNLAVLGKVLNEENMHDLYTVIFHSLQRGHKAMTRDEFDDLPIGALDAVNAVMTIARQTGVIRTARPGEAPLAQGQAAA